MSNRNSLTGVNLEKWLENFIKTKLLIKSYFPTPGNLKVSSLSGEKETGLNIEIDGLLLIGSVLIIIEIKNAKSNKTKNFLFNSTLIRECEHSRLVKAYKIPKTFWHDIENVQEYRHLYINMNLNFNSSDINKSKYKGSFSYIKDLFFLDNENIKYLDYLTKVIGAFAKFELFALLNLESGEIDSSSNSEFSLESFFEIKNRIVTTQGDKADIFVFSMKVNELLSISTVSRYNGLPLIFDNTLEGYQRIIKEGKVKDIATNYIKNRPYVIFPNSILLLLPTSSKIEGKELKIQNKYNSLEVIDGQHRLFAFGHKSVKKGIRDKTDLIVTGIRLKKPNDKNFIAARIFCEINSSQSKVSKNLLYQLKYDVLKEKNYESLASKVLLLCNDVKNSALHKVFLVNNLVKRNSLNLPPIPLTTIVDKELVFLLKGEKVKGGEIDNSRFTEIFKVKRKNIKSKSDKFCLNAARLIEIAFNEIKAIYSKDFGDKYSYLQSAKYYAVYLRLLRSHLFDDAQEISTFKPKIEKQKRKLKKFKQASDSCFFHKKNSSWPNLKQGISTIYDELIV